MFFFSVLKFADSTWYIFNDNLIDDLINCDTFHSVLLFRVVAGFVSLQVKG